MSSDATVFNEAVWRGKADVVQRALARLDPNVPDRWGRMPLAFVAHPRRAWCEALRRAVGNGHPAKERTVFEGSG